MGFRSMVMGTALALWAIGVAGCGASHERGEGEGEPCGEDTCGASEVCCALCGDSAACYAGGCPAIACPADGGPPTPDPEPEPGPPLCDPSATPCMLTSAPGCPERLPAAGGSCSIAGDDDCKYCDGSAGFLATWCEDGRWTEAVPGACASAP